MPNYKSKPYVLDLSIIVHIYSGALVIGDAYKIIDKLKDGNAYFDLFFDESKGGFTNEINEIKRNEIVNHFSLTSDGGCWTPIFASGTNLGVLNEVIPEGPP